MAEADSVLLSRARDAEADQAGWLRAQAAEKAAEFATAATLFEQIADDVGHPMAAKARRNLGRLYWDGRGVDKDLVVAIRHLEVAAKAGDHGAQYDLGQAYQHGDGVPKNTKQAAIYYRMAKAAGYPWAVEALASLKRPPEYEYVEPTEEEERAAQAAAERAAAQAAERRRLWAALSKFAFALVALAIGGLAVVNWRVLSEPVRQGLGLAAVALVPLLLFNSAGVIGAGNRRRIVQKFEGAVARTDTPWIGGVRWVISDGNFYRIGSDGRERGSTWEPETDRGSRFSIEIDANQKRRRWFTACMVGVFVAGLLTFVGSASAIAFLAFVLLIPVAAAFVILECLYRFGFQFIPGAMVLDPAPKSLRREEVDEQKAHGDARIASAAEAVAAGSYAGGGRSAAHSQKF